MEMMQTAIEEPVHKPTGIVSIYDQANSFLEESLVQGMFPACLIDEGLRTVQRGEPPPRDL